MAPLCASRLAAAAVVAAVVAAAVTFAAATPTVAVATPRVPTVGRLPDRQSISDPVDQAAEVVDVYDDGNLQCLPSLAPTCNLEAHMELASMRSCLPTGHSPAARQARSEFARIESMVAAALPISTAACCYAKATMEDIRVALLNLAPAIHCSTGGASLPDTMPNPVTDLSAGGLVVSWGSVVIPGDDSLWCCDSQNYAPNDPANQPCCVDGCYDMAEMLGWLGYTLDSCCAVLSNRKQYGRVCPPDTIKKVRVQ